MLEAKQAQNFYPRPPRGGRPTPVISLKTSASFLSTPSARRATWRAWPCWVKRGISIHALREEGDLWPRKLSCSQERISIHALREEGDLLPLLLLRPHTAFLSTPSARRATLSWCPPLWWRLFLSTPSARRATASPNMALVVCSISIHALREEGDHWPSKTLASMRLFLSTPSARRATEPSISSTPQSEAISIHALREEGDFFKRDSPHFPAIISIHALREEGDG